MGSASHGLSGEGSGGEDGSGGRGSDGRGGAGKQRTRVDRHRDANLSVSETTYTRNTVARAVDGKFLMRLWPSATTNECVVAQCHYQ